MSEQTATRLIDGKEQTARMAERAWSTPQIGMVLGSLFLLYFFASFLGLLFYEEQLPLVRLSATFLIYTSIVALIVFLGRQQDYSWTDGFGMGVRQLRHLAFAPLLYLVTTPFLILATKAWHLLLQRAFGLDIELQEVVQIVMQDLSWLQILYILTAISIAPLFEELLFRGLVFPYLVKHTGLAGAAVLVSLLFGALHFHLPSFLPLFLLSIVLCISYWRTGSLWISIGMHTIFNAVNILALSMAD